MTSGRKKVFILTEKLTLSVEEMGELLGVSRQTAYNLIHRADFPTLRIGKRVLIPKKQLEAWMDRQLGGDSDVFDQAV